MRLDGAIDSLVDKANASGFVLCAGPTGHFLRRVQLKGPKPEMQRDGLVIGQY